MSLDMTYCSANCRAACNRNLKQWLRKREGLDQHDYSWFDFSLECPQYDPLIVQREEFKQESDEAFTHD